MKELIYILYRRLKANLSSLLFFIFWMFNIDQRLVSVCTFEGKGGFGCNPKYIVKKLHEKDPGIKFVWFLNKNISSKDMPDYIKIVPNTLISRAYWLSRSKIWIDNYRKPYGTVKRKGQYYINTWHGMVGFKTIGMWRGNAFSKMAYIVSKKDSEMVDYFMSDSEFTLEYMPKGLLFDGEFLNYGSPRCDVLVNDLKEKRIAFRDKHGIPHEDKCLMLAPTFREIKSDAGKREVFVNDWNVNFERILKSMSEKFGGNWHICVRLHPQVAHLAVQTHNMHYIDLSSEEDMNENLAAMDALITDYSSCAMDAEMMHIPIFIYSNDIEQYQQKRGDFVWDITPKTRSKASLNKKIFPSLEATLPFSLAHNLDELEEDINVFDPKAYIQSLLKYEKDIKLIRDGKASLKTADFIYSLMSKK